MKIFNQNKLVSLRKRFKMLAGFLVLTIFASAWYGYQSLTSTRLQIAENLAERNSLLESSHMLRASLLDTYHAMNNFLLEPAHSEYRENIFSSIRESIDLSAQLTEKMSSLNNSDVDNARQLHKTLLEMATALDELIETRLDPLRQYPSLAVAQTVMRPNRIRMNNAFALALNALTDEEKLEDNPEVLASFIQLRHLWTQAMSNFRLYLANRMGSFDEEALPIQAQGVEAIYGQYMVKVDKLKPFFEEDMLGFETSEAYEEIRDAIVKWFEGFEQVKYIHKTSEWRIDATLIKNRIAPNVELASQLLKILDERLVLAAEKDIEKIGNVALKQTQVVWLVAGIATIFVWLVFISVEKLIFLPVSIIARGLKQEALGKSGMELPSSYSTETKDLVDAFGEMSRQIHLRQSELEYRALHDSLTSLPNRSLLFDHIEHDILIAKRDESNVALLILDLDRFKDINDTLGHPVGDQLLIEVGKRLKSILRGVDTVARMGGDEYAVLLPGVGEEEVAGIANKIIKESQPPYEINDLKLVVSASIGVAIYPTHGTDAKSLLQHADVAMYVSKQNQLGYSIYDPSQDKSSIMRFAMIADLREALENEGIELYYQPKLDLRSKQVLGVEALLRWRHPEHGYVQPEQVVELAENAGLISSLTYTVAKIAMSQVMLWHQHGMELDVSINISVHNLKDEDFVEEIRKILHTNHFPCESLTLEVTENAMMSDPMLAIDTLARLGDMGIKISVDDYGTGFSSLSYLSKLPVAELKIDKSFIIDMETDVNNETIVRSTIEMAHNLGLNVIAEGVETEQVWNMLREYGCNQAQGYYISKPITSAELEDWMTAQTKALA